MSGQQDAGTAQVALRPGDAAPRPPLPRSEARIMAGWPDDCTRPRVSIVCHAFNHAEYIRDALHGFLMQQTTFPFEIIVHDDASTDGTAAIVAEYQARYPRLIRAVLQSENQWQQGRKPRVFTFPLVRGDWCCLCEGDDYWLDAHKLARQAAQFAAGVAVVFHDALIIGDGRVLATSYYPRHKPLHGYDSHALCRGPRIPTASAMLLSECLLQMPQPDIVNGDHLIWAMSGHYGRAVFIDAVMSAYREHAGSVWTGRHALDRIEHALASKAAIAGLVQRPLLSAAVNDFCNVACQALVLAVQYRDGARARFVLGQLLASLRLLPRLDWGSSQSWLDLCRIGKYLLRTLKDVPCAFLRRRRVR